MFLVLFSASDKQVKQEVLNSAELIKMPNNNSTEPP